MPSVFRLVCIPFSFLKLIEKVFSISILPLSLLEVMRHPESHVKVALQFAVFTLLSSHLVDDHHSQERVMFFNAVSLYIIGVLEIC